MHTHTHMHRKNWMGLNVDIAPITPLALLSPREVNSVPSLPDEMKAQSILICVHSPRLPPPHPPLLQWHVKDPCYSAKVQVAGYT